jgi:hypothetical protein
MKLARRSLRARRRLALRPRAVTRAARLAALPKLRATQARVARPAAEA